MKKSFPVRAFTNWIYEWYRSNIRHPKFRWFIIAGTLVYLLDPFDLSPDMIPIIGWVDDGLLTTVLVTEVSQMLIDRRKAQKNNSPIANPTAETALIDLKAVSMR